MKGKLIFLSALIFVCAQLSAQSFYGVVKKTDSLSSPIFQAKVEVTEDEKPFGTYKTYFDGGYKFNVNKNQTYTVKISYSGFTDTTFTIKTDKAGKPFPEYISVRLKKDGMRLMGMLKSREENFPIKEAAVVLKNVMTKKEDRIITGIDGLYNFKLEYETNYKVSIDKRSIGIYNQFKDTSFYVSTIGFNQPLDYKLDIYLDPVQYIDPVSLKEKYPTTLQKTVTVSNDTKATPTKSSPEVKQPFVVEEKKKKESDETVAKLQRELEETKKQLEEMKKKEEDRKKGGGGGASISTGGNKKKEKQDPNIEVVVIKDEPVKKTPSESVAKNQEEIKKLQAEAETKSLQIEAQIKKQKDEEQSKKTAEDFATKQQAYEDSLMKVKDESERLLMASATQNQKRKDDSIAAENLKQQAMTKAKAEKELALKEAAARRQVEDSLKRVALTSHLKSIQDSVSKAKTERENAAKEIAWKKTMEDSIKKAVHAVFVLDSTKRAKETVAKNFEQDSIKKVLAAEKAKLIQDSITQVKAEQQRKAKELAAKKAAEDSLKKINRAIYVQDSVAKAKEIFVKKHEQDSIKKVLAAEKAKQILDSITQVKAEQQRRAKELAAKKAVEDSLKKIARVIFLQDSVTKAKEIFAKKHEQDSIKKILVADKAKQIQDSITHVKAEQQRKAKEIAARKAVEDSLKNVTRVIFVQDSVAKAKEIFAKKHEQDSIKKVLAAEKAKLILDSITQVKAEQQRKAKELAAKKAVEDSVKKATALARIKFVSDSITKTKFQVDVKIKAHNDSIASARAKTTHLNSIDLLDSALAAWGGTLSPSKIEERKKFVADSIAQVKADKIRVAKEIAIRKAVEDSVKKVETLARTKFVADSVAQVRAEQTRIAKEVAAKKAVEESLNKIQGAHTR